MNGRGEFEALLALSVVAQFRLKRPEALPQQNDRER